MKPYEKYKASGVEWIGEIPEHWEVRKVKYNFNFKTGFTPPTGKNEYYGGENIWMNISDLKGKYICDSEKKITEKAIKDFSPYKVPENSLLYSFKLSVGKVSFVTVDCYTNEAIFSIIPDNSINLNFFYYSLPEQIIQNANENIYGAKLLNQELIKNADLIIPSSAEQTAIANFLDTETAKIDKTIATRQEQIELLKEYKSSVISHAVTKGIDPNAKMKDSGVEWIGEIPEHWEVSRLKFIGEAIIGITYNPSEITDEYQDDSFLVLRSSNIQNGNLDFSDCVFVKKDIKEKYITKKGDILLCARNGSAHLIGKSAYIDSEQKKWTFGAFMSIVRSDLKKYLFYYFNSQIFESQKGLYTTSTINQLTSNTLNNMFVSFPYSISEQQQIVSHIEERTAKIDAAIDKYQEEIELLKEYRASLITEAVTGKIDVRNY